MNNYLLQRFLCTPSIKRFPLKSFGNNRAHVLSNHFSTKQQPVTNPESKWITIYRFPYIRLAASVANIRKFQYSVTCVAPPVTYAFEHYQLVPEYSTILALSLSLSLSLTLTFCGLMLRRLVGFVYVDEERKHIRIGYLTFGGRREDKVIEIEDLKTLAETQKFKYQPFQTITTYSNNTKYKLIDLGGVIRRDDYELVFGKY